MRILVTNDDGIAGPGLAELARAAAELGEVRVVAPDRQRSGCGHAITMHEPLRLMETELAGFPAYSVNGVPTDCVNVGIDIAWGGECDLVLSGINDGPNLGFDVTYSGTAAAAIEAVVNGVRGVAISMACYAEETDPHFASGGRWVREELAGLLERDLPNMSFWNVNVPALPPDRIRGQRFARLGRRIYEGRVERRLDPWGRPYYWQGGVVVRGDGSPATDVEAVEQGYVAISPVTIDWTDERTLAGLEA